MAHVEYKLEEATPQRKSRSMVFIACLAALVLVAGGTLAYLTTTTNSAENMFIAGNIDAELEESNWEPTSAENMLPSVTVDKNPLITNTSAFEVDEWTGIMLTFQKPTAIDEVTGKPVGWKNMTDEEVAALLVGLGTKVGTGDVTVAGLNLASNWDNQIDITGLANPIPGQHVYAYSTAISETVSTDTIFDRVGVLAGAGSDDWDGDIDNVTLGNYMTWVHTPLEDGGLEGYYQIVVSGAAVQDGGQDAAEVNKSILKLFGYTLV